LVSDDEPKGRLFHELVKGHVSNRPIHLGSGRQFVRFSSAQDAANQISWLINNAVADPRSLPERVELNYADCMSVRELNKRCAGILKSDQNLARFNSKSDAEFEFYEQVRTYFELEKLPACEDDLRTIILGLANALSQKTRRLMLLD